MSFEHKENNRPDAPPPENGALRWHSNGVAAVPYRVFFDPAIYELEQHRLFRGPVWNYLCLEAELPGRGDYKTTFVGDMTTRLPIVSYRVRNGRMI